MDAADYDILIIGAGISGIGMAAHLRRYCPDKSFAIIERREDIGGTWDLFRYPGVRSDSDMHTLGYSFAPWLERKAIANGDSILRYLHRVVEEHKLRGFMQFQRMVHAADWDSAAALWRVKISATPQASAATQEITARFLYIGAGYYDYDTPYRADFRGQDDFVGDIIHPQFWQQDYDYQGKRVIVIGSGATAATIVPAMAKQAAHVTLLQRTPTWYFMREREDKIANFLRHRVSDRLASAFTRFKNIRMQQFFFYMARRFPDKTANDLKQPIAEILGDAYDDKDFSPPYKPWEQRLCLVPEGDLFHAIKQGKATIVTDHIDHFDAQGIRLQSGRHIPADVIITATGLQLSMAGKIALSCGGEPVDWNQHFYYKGCMLSNIPNMAFVFGYLNASWTLKADIVSRYICRLLTHMDAHGIKTATPRLSPAEQENLPQDDSMFGFSSGYLERGQSVLPRLSTQAPWRLDQNYHREKHVLEKKPLADGILHFE